MFLEDHQANVHRRYIAMPKREDEIKCTWFDCIITRSWHGICSNERINGVVVGKTDDDRSCLGEGNVREWNFVSARR